MKIFRTECDNEHHEENPELTEQFDVIEQVLGDLRQQIGQQHTLLKNAEKKLQEFQDTIYAMMMEDDYPHRQAAAPADDDSQADEMLLADEEEQADF